MSAVFLHHRPQPLGVRVVETVEHALERAADHLQRRPQFVRHVRQQLLSPAFVRLEALGHLIEGGAETPELPGRRGVDAGVVVAGGDTVGRIHQPADRAGVAPQPSRDADETCEHDHGDDDEDP